MGSDGKLSSSSVLDNFGTVRKDNPAGPSNLTGTYKHQVGALIEVLNGATLALDGGDQQYLGGAIKANGTLELKSLVGKVRHEFDGLTEINGTGSVIQVTDFVLKKNLTLNLSGSSGGYVPHDIAFTNNAQLKNTGRVHFTGTAEFTGAGHFLNSGVVTNTGSPLFRVPVTNAATFSSRSFRLGHQPFINVGQLNLNNNGHQISDVGPGFPTNAVLHNLAPGIISYQPTSTNEIFRIAAPFTQAAGAKFVCQKGILEFVDKGLDLAGTMETVNANSTLLYVNEATFAVASGDNPLLFDGSGIVRWGETLSGAHLTIPTGAKAINKTAFNLPTTELGFWFMKGTFTLQNNARFSNQGLFHWVRGDITGPASAIASFRNEQNARLIIEPGTNKKLGIFLTNKGTVFQKSNVTLLAPSTNVYGGRIDNTPFFGVWQFVDTSSITGPTQTNIDEATFHNSGTVIQNHAGTSTIDVDMQNDTTVRAVQGTLVINHAHNFSTNGTLIDGTWEVRNGAAIQFPKPVTRLRDGATWQGSGSESITEIGSSTNFEASASIILEDGQFRTNTLTIHKTGILRLRGTAAVHRAAGLSLLLDVDGGRITGEGLIEDSLLRNGGTLAPGKSPGTLTVDGNLVMNNARYEVELAGITPASYDHLIITQTATVSGVIAPALIDGYIPTVGETFTILTANTITGTFSSIDLSAVGGWRTFQVSYFPTSIVLTAQAAAYSSYAAWRSNMFTVAEQADPSISGIHADADGDGIVNFMEYTHALRAKVPDEAPMTLLNFTPGDGMTPHLVDLQFPWADGLNDADYQSRFTTDLNTPWIVIPHTLVNQSSDGITSTLDLRMEVPAPYPETSFLYLEVFGN